MLRSSFKSHRRWIDILSAVNDIDVLDGSQSGRITCSLYSCCIYAWFTLDCSDFYIGQTKQFVARMKQHRKGMVNEKLTKL